MTNQMKNLLLLGTISFTVAFSLGIVVEKSVPKIAIIAGIGTISTLSSALILSKKFEQEREHIDSYTANLKSLEDQILKQKRQKKKLIQSIDSTTQLKVNIESEYNAIISEISNLQEEIKSLNTQRENLENVIFNLENKERKILELVENKTQQKTTIEQENSSLLVKEPKNKFFKQTQYLTEKNTLYAQNLLSISKDFWSIYEYNIETFRSQIPRNNWGHYWGQLAHGLNILSEENAVLAYFAFYGGSHYYKLLYLLDRFFNNVTKLSLDINLEIIDYGCGQALGTTCCFDYLRQQSLSNIKIEAITLIEPSEISLSRGIVHINHLCLDSENIDIKIINKQLQYLNKNDLLTSNKSIKLHIFSNILDITGFEINNLANTIKESQSGINYFLCVSPTDLKNRIRQFSNFWHQNGAYIEEITLSAEDLYEETWRFKSDKFKREKIHRVQKLFYVNL